MNDTHAPSMILVGICDTCSQPWHTHERTAQRRADREFIFSDGDRYIEPVIDLRDCVLALKADTTSQEAS